MRGRTTSRSADSATSSGREVRRSRPGARRAPPADKRQGGQRGRTRVRDVASGKSRNPPRRHVRVQARRPMAAATRRARPDGSAGNQIRDRGRRPFKPRRMGATARRDRSPAPRASGGTRRERRRFRGTSRGGRAAPPGGECGADPVHGQALRPRTTAKDSHTRTMRSSSPAAAVLWPAARRN